MPTADGLPDLASLTVLGNEHNFTVASGSGTTPPPPPPPEEEDPVVKLSDVQPGDDNDSVTVVQEALIAQGFSIPSGATGYFGTETQAAYQDYQESLGYTGSDADGIPGCTSLTTLGQREGFSTTCDITSPPPPTGTGGRAAAPIKAGYSYYISKAYGTPGNYAAGYHTGRDYAANSGVPLVAVLDGTISRTGYDAGGYGNFIVLAAVNGRDYWYCHLSSIAVSSGSVVANQTIGYVGSTGNSTGPHCHFEDRPRGGGYGNVRNPSW